MKPGTPKAAIALLLALAGVGTLIAMYASGWYPRAAEVHDVQIDNFDFRPSDVVIRAGDVVRWRVGAGHHSATAVGAGFDSGLMPPGGEYSHRFEQAGPRGYHCELHDFMRGSITVTAPRPWRALIFWSMMLLTLGLFSILLPK